MKQLKVTRKLCVYVCNRCSKLQTDCLKTVEGVDYTNFSFYISRFGLKIFNVLVPNCKYDSLNTKVVLKLFHLSTLKHMMKLMIRQMMNGTYKEILEVCKAKSPYYTSLSFNKESNLFSDSGLLVISKMTILWKVKTN